MNPKRTNKRNIYEEMCKYLDVEPIPKKGRTEGGTITGTHLKPLLESLKQNLDVPFAQLPEHEQYIQRLVSRSVEAMALAIEIANKVMIHHRTEAFLFLLINSWELLLKAEIIQKNGAIDKIFRDSDKSRTIEFIGCLKQNYPNDKDPERLGLHRLYDWRNEAAHLFLDFIPGQVMLLAQSAVFNYERRLRAAFNRSLSDFVPNGMLFLIVEFNPEYFNLDKVILNKKLPKTSLEFIKKWKDAIEQDLKEIPDGYKNQYFIKVDYDIHLKNNPNKSDEVWMLGNEGAIIQIVKSGDSDREYPYLTKQVIPEINKRFNSKLTTADLYAINDSYKIKQNHSFCKEYKHHKSQPQYSEVFVNWVGEQLQFDKNFLAKARKKRNNHLVRMRKRAIKL